MGISGKESRDSDADEGCPRGMVMIKGGALSAHRKGPVAINPMCMDRTEVTVKSYEECVAKGACPEPESGKACNWGVADRQSHPVNCVDLKSAETYCRQRHARLPTHDEWEWAASGGTASTLYPWGNSPPSDRACWSGVAKRSGTCPVASFPAGDSPDGISDLSGNVEEWTSTPFWGAEGEFLMRGGYWWDTDADMLRTDVTNHGPPGTTFDGIGFRCIANVDLNGK